MDNSINDAEDNIRPPDEVKMEQLLEDTRSDFEKEIDQAIYLSFQEIRNQEEIARKYEEQILKDYNEESIKRKQIFEKFLFDLNKLSRFDKEVRDIYAIIDPIIESYCSQYINNCEIDIDSYESIFKLLDKIRTDKNAIEVLKSIITIDEFSLIKGI